MKLSFIGLPLSGKTTLFEALSRTTGGPEQKSENRIGMVNVPDIRIDRLSAMYNPKKTTYAKVNYFLPGAVMGADQKAKEQRWADVRDSDAFIHVIRNFDQPGYGAPQPAADFKKIEEELIFADLLVTEKRLERLEADKKKGRGYDAEEHRLMQDIHAMLENEEPLRSRPDLTAHPLLKGFAFLSGKPVLVVFNNDDHNETMPDLTGHEGRTDCMAVRVQLEHEISRMNDSDAAEFLQEYGIHETARNRIIQKSYEMLGLISYFTVGEDEVRAWTIQRESTAVEAAGEIHSDIQKGFIRAETISYDDLMAAGSMAEARKKGTVRLEGKTYIVQDGDIMNFRFNV
ncbi:redox-regulated ATPase YchF [bacterium]|nr:redox-regulated ATPase YchF [bacterium]